MSLLTVILVLIVIGIVLYLIDRFVPMDATVKRILYIVVILVIVIWLMKALGLFAALSSVRI